jgi:uncharacterized protein YfaP (DUF2135 family)
MFKISIRFLCLLALCSASIFAQAGNGGVTGTVRDASGSPVPNAAVSVVNTAKGIKRDIQTTGSGVFNAPSLVPAAGYSVEVTAAGFAKYEATNLTVQVGSNVDLDVVLQIASATQTVEVSAVAETVDDTKSGVADLVSQLQIDNLPINGRRADTFALLTPGVTRDGTFGLVSFHGISAGNAFMTDGNYTTDSFYSENAGRTRISTQISQDAVQEFQVLSDGYSAEFGRAMGGIVNTVTRSGTNDYHGTAYEFFRNRTLDATDRYATFNPKEWRHQAGGTVGGPIKKDKLFFFTNFELVKRNFPGLNRITTSLIADPTGTFVLPSNCTVSAKAATQAQCNAASAFIQKQMNVLVPRTVSSDIGFAKLDYHLNDRNSFTANLNVMHWVSPNGIQTQSVLSSGAMLGNNGNSTVETRYGNLDWTYIISPSALNDFRFGWFKDRLSDPAASALWPSTGPLYITVAGATVGAAQAYPRTYPSENRFQYADNLSWTLGSHSVKVGVDTDRTQDYLKQLYNYAGGYSFSSLTAFAENFSGTSAPAYSTFTQEFGNPIQNLYTTNLNFYAQDLWKVTRKLTLNYGIRYEKSFLQQPTESNPAYPQTGKIPSANHNFAPRFSLAYAADDKTVLRAGFGIFYAPYITDGIDTLFLGNGLYQTSISVNPTQSGAPIFPNVVASASSVPAGTINLTYADPHFHNPYSEQSTFAIERRLPWGMDMTASTVYVRGVGLITSPDVNLSAPTLTGTYTIDNTAGQAVGTFTTPIWTAANKIDSRFAHIYEVGNGGESWYAAATLQVRKQMAHGFTGQLSYTWSHAIDDAQQSGASNTITYSQSSTYNGNFLNDKGTSGTDQRQRLVVNWLWAPTFTKSTGAFARYFVNGWQLSSITTIGTALPATGTISVSGTQFTGASALLYTGSINGSGGWGRVPFLPVNSQPIDNEYHVDARLSRSIPFTERIKASLMFEAFNVFNTQFNTGINTTAYTASGGVLKPVTSFGTGNASQAFPDGTNARRMQAAFRLEF